MRLAAGWLVVSVLLSAMGCGAPRPVARDVVVVVLDTVRRDRTSVYAPGSDTMPFLAEFAEQSVVFENAWATSSWTAPSVASVFTGLYPNQHGVDVGVWLFERLQPTRPELRLARIPQSLDTLPEVMRAQGFETFGIADNPNVSKAEGFSRGFDRFASADYRGGAEINALLADWAPAIRSADPAFVYLHYMDAHWPYHAHAQHLRQASAPGAHADERARYDAELRYLDARLREAFALLELGDDAIVVVVADHGEELYERGDEMENRQHGFQLYDELVRVLLLVRDRDRAPSGARVDAPVSLVDVLPTLRELVGAPADPDSAGRSLVASYATPEAVLPERPIFAMRREVSGDDRRMTAVVRDGWKYIRTQPAPAAGGAPGQAASGPAAGEVREELYDLQSDAAERHDRAAQQPERLAALREEWLAFDRTAPRWEPERATLAVSPEQAERLRALGYADTPAGASGRPPDVEP